MQKLGSLDTPRVPGRKRPYLIRTMTNLFRLGRVRSKLSYLLRLGEVIQIFIFRQIIQDILSAFVDIHQNHLVIEVFIILNDSPIYPTNRLLRLFRAGFRLRKAALQFFPAAAYISLKTCFCVHYFILELLIQTLDFIPGLILLLSAEICGLADRIQDRALIMACCFKAD